MSRTVQYEAAAATEAQSNSFAPIPAGRYQFQIGGLEEKPASKPGTLNASKSVLNVKLKIVSEGDLKGRVTFARVPLFQKWAPTGKPGAKYPDGTPAFLYFSFFKALGYEVGNPAGDTLPDDSDIQGRFVEAQLELRGPDDFNPDGSNEVKYFNASSFKVTDPLEKELATIWIAPAATAETATVGF